MWSAIEAQEFDRALGYLTDDFQFSGPMPVPGIPREEFTATLRDGKVAALHIHALSKGGLPVILDQMGVALPHA